MFVDDCFYERQAKRQTTERKIVGNIKKLLVKFIKETERKLQHVKKHLDMFEACSFSFYLICSL